MITLSICMIVKNEEDVLARCLSCIEDIADEIIIVDTGSADRTKEIAREFTPHIYEFEWCDDFAAARNFSFSKATMEYTMWLDADDVINEENRTLLLKLKSSLPSGTDIVMMKYDVAFDEQGNATFSYYRERLFKTACNYQWIGEIHEVIPCTGTVEYREICIQHRKEHPSEKGRNLRIFEKMLSEGKMFDARQQFYYARELMYDKQYNSAVVNLQAFLREGKGWIENRINACQDLANCYYHLGDHDAALQSLFLSFSLDTPRAEICCDIGWHFLQQEQYRTAAFWYELASSREMQDKSGGFCMPDCYGYTPFMQLCVCYDKLGNYEKAAEWNEKAGSLKPDDRNYLSNKVYFQNML